MDRMTKLNAAQANLVRRMFVVMYNAKSVVIYCHLFLLNLVQKFKACFLLFLFLSIFFAKMSNLIVAALSSSEGPWVCAVTYSDHCVLFLKKEISFFKESLHPGV